MLARAVLFLFSVTVTFGSEDVAGGVHSTAKADKSATKAEAPDDSTSKDAASSGYGNYGSYTKKYASGYQKYMSQGDQGKGKSGSATGNVPAYANKYVSKFAPGFEKYMDYKHAQADRQKTQSGQSADYTHWQKYTNGGSQGGGSQGGGDYQKYYKHYMNGGQGSGSGQSGQGGGDYQHYYKQYMNGGSQGGSSSSSGQGGGDYQHYYKHYMNGGSQGGSSSGSGQGGDYKQYYKKYMDQYSGHKKGTEQPSDKSSGKAPSKTASGDAKAPASSAPHTAPKVVDLQQAMHNLRQQMPVSAQLPKAVTKAAEPLKQQEQLATEATRAAQQTTGTGILAVGCLVAVSLSAFSFFRYQQRQEASDDSVYALYLQA